MDLKIQFAFEGARSGFQRVNVDVGNCYLPTIKAILKNSFEIPNWFTHSAGFGMIGRSFCALNAEYVDWLMDEWFQQIKQGNYLDLKVSCAAMLHYSDPSHAMREAFEEFLYDYNDEFDYERVWECYDRAKKQTFAVAETRDGLLFFTLRDNAREDEDYDEDEDEPRFEFAYSHSLSKAEDAARSVIPNPKEIYDGFKS